MPQLPRIERRGQVPSLELPRPGTESFGLGIGKGLEEIGGTLMHLQEGADRAEATKLIGVTQAKFNQTIQESHDEIIDPTEFNKTATDNVTAIHQQTLDAATNSRVRKLVSDNLSNDLIIAQTKIKHVTFQKTRVQALADENVAFDQLAGAAAKESNPENRKQIYGMYGQLVGNMKGHGFYEADDAQKRLKAFDSAVAVGDLNKAFKEGDVATLEKFLLGDFDIRLTETQQATIMTRANVLYNRNNGLIEKQKKQEMDDVRDQTIIGVETGKIADWKGTALDLLNKKQIDFTRYKEIETAGMANEKSGGVRVSDRATYDDLTFRLHAGQSLNFNEIRDKSSKGLLNRDDTRELLTGLDARVRRDKDEKDISKDPLYQRSKEYIARSLPSSDRLDLDQKTKTIVANALRDFDAQARSGNFKTTQFGDLAERLIESAFVRMGKEAIYLETRLLPGINSPQDAISAARQGLIDPETLKNQLKIFERMRRSGSRPMQAGPGTGSKEKARGLGVQ